MKENTIDHCPKWLIDGDDDGGNFIILAVHSYR